MSDRGTRELFYRLKLSFTVPTYILAKVDPAKQEAFVQYKKLLNGEIDRILFIDESMIRNYQGLSRTWFPKGKQKIVFIQNNAKIFHAALIQPFLTEHQSVLTLLYLPPYSPKLNLIERLW
ncbi:transposase [Paenibacillus sp. 1011MAR3C5]|uniref:transposase n=1 Tax=Paenibacillus sp. 1011MAR3C5 TaxID=1675787 RepID=UPI0016049783|nr:transposase [Paenibacillus sp. 1011MAR3C5]